MVNSFLYVETNLKENMKGKKAKMIGTAGKGQILANQ